MNTVERSAETLTNEGRTLTGRAMRYSRPSRVTNDNRNYFYEEVIKGAAKRSIDRSVVFPFFQGHSIRGGIKIGDVTFADSESENALLFEAVVDRSKAGDAYLRDLEDYKDVSATFDVLRTTTRTTNAHGKVLQVRELRINELAGVTTGSGQYDGAEIEAVRSALLTPRLDAARERRRKSGLILL